MTGNPSFTKTDNSIMIQTGFNFQHIYGRPSNPFLQVEYNDCEGNKNKQTVTDVTPFFKNNLVELSRFKITDVATFQYSAWCETPGGLDKTGFFHLANYDGGVYQMMPHMFLLNPKVFIVRQFRRSENGGEYGVLVEPFTTLLGRFDACKEKSSDSPNVNVYNAKKDMTQFEVFKDVYFEANYIKVFRKQNAFRFEDTSLQMKILKGLIFNGSKAKIVGHSTPTKSMVYIADKNATLHYNGKVFSGVEAEMLFSGNGQYSLFVRSKNTWYQMLKELIPSEMEFKFRCLGLENIINHGEVCYSLTSAFNSKLFDECILIITSKPLEITKDTITYLTLG